MSSAVTAPQVTVEDVRSATGGIVYRVYCDHCGYVRTGEPQQVAAQAHVRRHLDRFHPLEVSA